MRRLTEKLINDTMFYDRVLYISIIIGLIIMSLWHGG